MSNKILRVLLIAGFTIHFIECRHIAHAGSTDPTAILSEPVISLPAPMSSYTDPTFGSTIKRITPPSGSNMLVPEYSQLQAWNADMTMIMLRVENRHLVYNANTWEKIVDLWGGECWRWSPIYPDVLYYYDNNKLVKFDVSTATSTTLRTFTEYQTLQKDYSYEEISLNGKSMVIVGSRVTDGIGEAFIYDLDNNVKHNPVVFPLYKDPGQSWDNTPRFPDWAGISPSGNYILISWASGLNRYYGIESYDREGNYVGKVFAGIGHGDSIIDANGQEWHVVTNANNGYCPGDWPGIVKAKIPNGVLIDNTNVADCTNTLAQGLTVKLLDLDWYLGIHVSGKASKDPDYIIMSTEWDNVHPRPAMADEIVKVYLDSTPANPHIERLAHTRTNSQKDYWAGAHATVKRDGTQIVFGSIWRQDNMIPLPIDSYILNLSSSPEGGIPTAPKYLKVQ